MIYLWWRLRWLLVTRPTFLFYLPYFLYKSAVDEDAKRLPINASAHDGVLRHMPALLEASPRGF
jgi:hypothetical protein